MIYEQYAFTWCYTCTIHPQCHLISLFIYIVSSRSVTTLLIGRRRAGTSASTHERYNDDVCIIIDSQHIHPSFFFCNGHIVWTIFVTNCIAFCVTSKSAKPSLKSSAAIIVHPIYIEFQYMSIIRKNILNQMITKHGGMQCYDFRVKTAIPISVAPLFVYHITISFILRVLNQYWFG